MGGGLSGILDSKGTLSEENKGNKEKNGADAANIMNAGASGLDSIANFISSVTGNGGNANNNNNSNYAPPPPEKKVNPLLIGGIVGTVFLIIVVLILTKNGKANGGTAAE